MKALILMTILINLFSCTRSPDPDKRVQWYPEQEKVREPARYDPEMDPNKNSLSNQPAAPLQGVQH